MKGILYLADVRAMVWVDQSAYRISQKSSQCRKHSTVVYDFQETDQQTSLSHILVYTTISSYRRRPVSRGGGVAHAGIAY